MKSFLQKLFSKKTPSITQKSIEVWRSKWIKDQCRQSQHPIAFWQKVARVLLKGRVLMKNNPITPIGHYVMSWPNAMGYLTERNNQGIDLEKKGKIEEAIFAYEVSINDAFFGTHPYNRLRIIYSKRQWYKDAIRVCKIYLALPDREHGQDKPHFRHHLEKLQKKLEK